MDDTRATVLLIEDSPGDARLIRELIAEAAPAAFALEHAGDLASGLARLAQGGIGLVLLDLSLPESRGLDTFATVNARAPELPIVVLTGLDDEAVARAAVQQGAQDYLLKGHVDGGLLARAMRYAIERKRTKEALREARDELAQRVEERTAELRDALESLRRNEQRYALAQKAAQVGSWERDIATGRLYWSEAIEPMFGFAPGTFPGTREAFLKRVHPDDRQHVIESVRACVEEGKEYDIEHRVVWPDGTVRWVAETGNVVRDAAGRPVRTFGIVQDITARKEAEEERASLQEQIRYAQKLESLGVLAGGIAHDFNNLLMAILGNADLALLDLPPAAPARRRVEGIRQATIRASELTSQLLAYSGRGQFVIQALDLNELVEEMSHLLDVSISKMVALKCDFAADLPPVEMDAAQIRQVVMNLITNASEAIGDREGVITIRTSVVEADRAYLISAYLDQDLPEGRYAVLEVADTGCGMDEDTQARLFDPFFTTKFAGRGLGLAAVLGIVRGHRGGIKVYSEPGKGSVFRILLPCAGAPAQAPAARVASADTGEFWRGTGTVLVAEDELAIRDVARAALERRGFTVLTARDGQEAVELFRDHADDIVAVLLDMAMPRMGGEEALRELRRVRDDVPIVATSGYGEQDAAERLGEDGVVGFLQKPFALSRLIAKLREAIEGPR